jgi:phosphopantetheinyl transferase
MLDGPDIDVKLYFCRIADLRLVPNTNWGRSAPVFIKRARHLREHSSEAAKISALCELGVGALLSGVLGVTNDDQLSYGRYGKPALNSQAIHISISHTSDLVVLATSNDSVGVDAEEIPSSLSRPRILALGRVLGIAHQAKEQPSPKLIRLAPTPEAWSREWTRAEAIVKAIGTGFAVAPARYITHMQEWQCSWEQIDNDIICCATRKRPVIKLHPFDVYAWACDLDEPRGK